MTNHGWLLWQGLGLAIGASLMDLKRATTLASVTVMTFMLAGGYFVKVRKQAPLSIRTSRMRIKKLSTEVRLIVHAYMT